MIKKSMMLCLTVIAMCTFALAASKTYVGTVSDEHCGAKHAMAGDAATACVKKCAAGGAKYTLVYRGKAYPVEPQDMFAEHAGHKVKVTGELKAGTITATNVEMVTAKAKKSKKSKMKM
ncbi:MAG TPA: hypothetical protein VGV68_09135 [Terriglobia bacterium]|nr:hypothetical protein [Terriglobia bacterium]